MADSTNSGTTKRELREALRALVDASVELRSAELMYESPAYRKAELAMHAAQLAATAILARPAHPGPFVVKYDNDWLAVAYDDDGSVDYYEWTSERSNRTEWSTRDAAAKAKGACGGYGRVVAITKRKRSPNV